MSNVLIATAKSVRAMAERHDAVLVAFSGGKDSLVVLDLCRRAFRRVACFHLEWVPGLRLTRERVGDVCDRLGVPVRYYVDPKRVDCLRAGRFCDPLPEYDRLPRLDDRDVYRLAMRDAGCEVVATGKKEADYRQRAFHLRGGRVFGWHPIQKWRKADVLAYLRCHWIAPPPTHAEAGGIDLTAASLNWLYREHPDDFARIEEMFPYVRTVVKRQEIRAGRTAAADEVRGLPA